MTQGERILEYIDTNGSITPFKAAAAGVYYRGEPIDIPLEDTVGGEIAERNWNRRA